MIDKNAGRDVDHLLKQFGLALKVPRETLVFPVNNGDETILLPWIRPSAWVQYMLQKYPMLVAGVTENPKRSFRRFGMPTKAYTQGIVFSSGQIGYEEQFRYYFMAMRVGI